MNNDLNFAEKNPATAQRQEVGAFPLFLRGVLEKVVCRTWLFDGKNVVKCVVNVDRKQHVLGP
jgi:hypothetical protein